MKFCCNIGILFQSNPKNSDLSHKTDLDFGIVLEGGETSSYNRKNKAIILWSNLYIKHQPDKCSTLCLYYTFSLRLDYDY